MLSISKRVYIKTPRDSNSSKEPLSFSVTTTPNPQDRASRTTKPYGSYLEGTTSISDFW